VEPSARSGLAAAARRYLAAEPWEAVTDAYLFGIHDRASGRLGCAAVMGAAGLEYGLSLMLGAEGFALFRKLQEEELDYATMKARSSSMAFSVTKDVAPSSRAFRRLRPLLVDDAKVKAPVRGYLTGWRMLPGLRPRGLESEEARGEPRRDLAGEPDGRPCRAGRARRPGATPWTRPPGGGGRERGRGSCAETRPSPRSGGSGRGRRCRRSSWAVRSGWGAPGPTPGRGGGDWPTTWRSVGCGRQDGGSDANARPRRAEPALPTPEPALLGAREPGARRPWGGRHSGSGRSASRARTRARRTSRSSIRSSSLRISADARGRTRSSNSRLRPSSRPS